MSSIARHIPRNLRARLVLWVGLLLAVVLVAFSTSVYAILDRSLSGQIDQSLRERAVQVNEAVARQAARPHPHRRGAFDIPPPTTFESADTFIQVATLQGEVVDTPFDSSDTTLPLGAATLTRVRSGQSVYETASVDSESVGVYSTPLVVRGQIVGVLQIGRSIRFVERALAQLRMFAALGLLIALALALLGVWLMTGRTLRPLERLIRTAQGIGSSRDLSRRVELPGTDDEVGRLAVTFNDMLARLQSSDAQLREALESQRRFVADASHELRTPLTTIRGNAGMLRQVAEMSREDRAEAMEEIHREAERMSRLVSDLLALARADAGLSLRQEAVDLASVVRDVTAQASRLAGERQLDLEALDAATVAGDSDALRQLALILLDNAIKYTPPGGRIAVRLDVKDSEARLVVADTGVGIEPEHLPHIFERFYRADPARTAGGTGLGLSIARWIAEGHCGRIEAASVHGKGATFTVYLPVVPASVELAGATDRQIPEPPARPATHPA